MAIGRNAGLNLIGTLVPTIVSFVSLPIYLRLIGEQRYGILAIAWILLGYFGLFDLGLGRATAQRVSALRLRDVSEHADTIWSALALNLGLGLLGVLIIWPTAEYVLGSFINAPMDLRAEIVGSVPWLALALPVAVLISVLSGFLQGEEKFVHLNVISIIGTLLFQLLPIASALIWGPDLRTLLPSVLLARLLTVIGLFFSVLVAIRFRRPRFVASEARYLLGFGSWITVSWIVGPLMTTFDRFLIGAIAGPTQVTRYTVPYQLGDRANMVATALGGALFPRFGYATDEERYRVAIKALATLLALLTPLMASGILLMFPFLGWWISSQMAISSAGVGQILLIGFWLNGLTIVPWALLQGSGRPNIVAKCHLLELPFYALALFVGLKTFGIIGAALAFSLRTLLDFFLLSWFAGLLKVSLARIVMPASTLFLAMMIASYVREFSALWILSAVSLIGAVLWSVPPQGLEALMQLLPAVIKRRRTPDVIG